MVESNPAWWQDVLVMLLRRRGLILVVAAAGTAAAAALAVSQRPAYVATAKLMLSPERADMLVSPDADARSIVRSSNQDVNSEVALLRSTDLVREVLEPYRGRGNAARGEPDALTRAVNFLVRLPSLPLQLYRALHAVPSPDAFQAWVLAATDRVTVMPIGRSNLLSVSYQDGDPVWAAEFVNQLVLRHVERRVRLNQQLDARRFYENQRDLLKERIGEAEAALRQFTEREGTQAVPEQRAAARTRLAELEAAMGTADTELAEASARVAFLSKLSAQMRASGTSGATVAAQNDPKQIVQGRILELELQRSELLSTFAPTSIKVQDVDHQLAEARRLLADAGPSAGFVDSTRQTLETDLAQTRVQIAAVTARKDTLRQQVDAYRTKLEHLDQVATEYDHLVQEVETAGQSFLTYVKKEEEARFSDALDESKIVNVIVAEPAQVPLVPQPSKAPLVFALGAGLSLVAGIIVAFLRDRLDPSVKSAGEAQRLTDLPVLADIPL